MSTPLGVPSSSTDIDSRNSASVRGRISSPIATDATTSAPVQPVTAITTAAAITASEPARSPSTSR